MPDVPPYPGAPRWVKISAIVAGALLLATVIMLAIGGGGHGPGRHAAPDDMARPGRWGLPVLVGALLLGGAALNWTRALDRGLPQRGSMTLTPRLRKLVLAAHVTTSVGSLGAVVVFLVLAIIGVISQDDQTVRAVYIANGLIAWSIILPLLLASLMIGVVQALATPWGLFRHYWVLAKLMLTIVTLYVLLQQMDGISRVADVAAQMPLSGTDLLGLRRSIRLHAVGGMVVLLVLVGLSIYKPRGLTLYGWRRQHEAAARPAP
jgi:hypothetical protein